MIPNGIDADDVLPVRPLSLDARNVTILYVGRIDLEQKGLEDLLRAVAMMDGRERVSVRLVGEDWGGTNVLRSIARNLGIARAVVLTGPLSREALRREYASADVFVLPSHFEPFGIVLLEAMAAGLPIVATPSVGYPR